MTSTKIKENPSVSTFHKPAKTTHDTNGKHQRKTSFTHKTEGNDKAGQTIPRNVNYYRHLIEDHYATEHGIEWVLKLRSPKSELDLTKKLESTTPNAPSFYGKKLESQNLLRTTIDLENKGGLFQLNHLLSKRIGPTPTRSQVNFETGLRVSGSTDKLRNLERKWTNIPKKDKANELPQLYPSYEETLKIKKIGQQKIFK